MKNQNQNDEHRFFWFDSDFDYFVFNVVFNDYFFDYFSFNVEV